MASHRVALSWKSLHGANEWFSFGTTFGGANVLFNFSYLTLFISVSSKMHLET
jgi:hypothetical protein